jgi:hypothetical protein
MTSTPAVRPELDQNWRTGAIAWAVVLAAAAVVTSIAIHRIRDFPYRLDFAQAWRAAYAMRATTAVAALRVWSFWSAFAVVATALVARISPEIGLIDAVLAGAALLWPLAFMIGTLLGPIGLWRGPTLWLMLGAGSLAIWRWPPKIRLAAPSIGLQIAALAFILLGIGLIPMALASPVPPFMDVLATPSSVQRIMTFGVYLPFNNDPYGCWGAYSRTPAVDLFYSALALGGAVPMAAPAISVAMVPMAAMLMLAAWRIGRLLFNDIAGGATSLLLVLTCLFRRAQGMRGTAVAFVLVGLGLGFFLDRRRTPARVALGALFLGTAVASHAIDGLSAMAVAILGVIYIFADYGGAGALRAALALVGAMMFAAPEFPIAFAYPVPYPALSIAQFTGFALIYLAARGDIGGATGDLESVRIVGVWSIVLLLWGVVLRQHFVHYTLFWQVWHNQPLLSVLGLVSVGLMLWLYFYEPTAMPYSGLAAVALMVGLGVELFGAVSAPFLHSLIARNMMSELFSKTWDYWIPWVLAIMAGLPFAFLYERFSSPLGLFLALAAVIYPWRMLPGPTYYDSMQHSMVEQWAFNLDTAANGYWIASPNRRWMLDRSGFELVRVLQGEVAAGRITTATHVAHITGEISSWKLLPFPVFTGINDDPIALHYDPNSLWNAGSRVRGPSAIRDLVTAPPPYILLQTELPPDYTLPSGYATIFHSGAIRLLRRQNLR